LKLALKDSWSYTCPALNITMKMKKRFTTE